MPTGVDGWVNWLGWLVECRLGLMGGLTGWVGWLAGDCYIVLIGAVISVLSK